MSTHNICFYGELRKVILELSLNSLICCTVPENILSRDPDVIKISDDKLKGKQLIMYNLSHVTRKAVFGMFRPGMTQTSLLCFSSLLVLKFWI